MAVPCECSVILRLERFAVKQRNKAKSKPESAEGAEVNRASSSRLDNRRFPPEGTEVAEVTER
jgi:hypothetical protein